MKSNIKNNLINIIDNNEILKSYFDSLYITGGFVRDYFYSEFHKVDFNFKDYDFVTSKNILEDNNIKLSKIEKKYLYHTLSCNSTLNSFRKDIVCYGRKADVEYSNNINDDIERRDFNINCIYYKLSTNEFIDLHNGINDIKLNKFRFIGNPEFRIKEDYTRIHRKQKLINFGYKYYEL